MNVLLFGGTGFLGKALVRRLDGDAGVERLTLATHRAEPPVTLSQKVVCRPASDFLSPGGSGRGERFDAVACLSGRIYSQSADEKIIKEANLDIPRLATDYCRSSVSAKFILASSVNVRLKLDHGYPAYKREAEKYLVASGVPHTILRPSLIYGPGDAGLSRLLAFIAKHRLVPVFGDGEKLEQPIQVEEAAAFFHQAITSPPANAAFDIGGQDAMTYNRLLLGIAESLQRQVRLLHLPAKPLVALLRVCEKIGLALPVNSEQILHIDTNLDIDNQPALRLFPVELSPFAKWIRAYAEQFRSR